MDAFRTDRVLEANLYLSVAGREVLRMYARLRGVPKVMREGLAERLLQRLSLAQYADRLPTSPALSPHSLSLQSVLIRHHAANKQRLRWGTHCKRLE